MPSSSPYATFCADAWMRESLIRPRKTLPADRAAPVPSRASARRRRSVAAPPLVQGELFLFPVVVA